MEIYPDIFRGSTCRFAYQRRVDRRPWLALRVAFLSPCDLMWKPGSLCDLTVDEKLTRSCNRGQSACKLFKRTIHIFVDSFLDFHPSNEPSSSPPPAACTACFKEGSLCCHRHSQSNFKFICASSHYTQLFIIISQCGPVQF